MVGNASLTLPDTDLLCERDQPAGTVFTGCRSRTVLLLPSGYAF